MDDELEVELVASEVILGIRIPCRSRRLGPQGCALETAVRHCGLEITRPQEVVGEDIPMTSSNAHDPSVSGPMDLTGVRILVVEDSWHIGIALKSLLNALGAEVIGPVATTSDAERMISEQAPNSALVDFSLRGGELAHGLIDRLNERGIRVIVISGYAAPPLAPGKVSAILQKPIVEAELLAALRPATEKK